jgi:hypothetical protein
LAQDFSTNLPSDRQDEPLPPYEEYELEVDETRPSLPIILISAACGIAGGVVGLYVTRIGLRWELPPSVFVAVLGLSLGLGTAGAGLSLLTGSRAAIANIVFSCGLIGASLVFFALCSLAGALGATLLFLR